MGTIIELSELVPACRRIHEVLDVEIPPGKPVLGERAYRHESGLHTAAMLREPSTYEPFDPGNYGSSRELLFGSETGRGAVRSLLANLDIDPTDERIDETLTVIRDRAQKRGEPLRESEARSLIREQDER